MAKQPNADKALPRQAGDVSRGGSLNASGLRFETADDAVNYGKNISKDCEDWLPRHSASVSESYVKGDLEIVLNVTIRRDCGEYHLVCVDVPTRRKDERRDRFPYSKGIDREANNPPRYFARNLVFVWPRGSAELAKQIVSSPMARPAWIWLERLDDRVEFRRDLLGEAASKVFRVCGERKIDLTDISATDERDAIAKGLVESMSEVAKSGCCDMSSSVGQDPAEHDLVSLVAGLRIYVNDIGAAAIVDDDVADLFKFGDIRTRLSNKEMRALKRRGHGENSEEGRT